MAYNTKNKWHVYIYIEKDTILFIKGTKRNYRSKIQMTKKWLGRRYQSPKALFIHTSFFLVGKMTKIKPQSNSR